MKLTMSSTVEMLPLLLPPTPRPLSPSLKKAPPGDTDREEWRREERGRERRDREEWKKEDRWRSGRERREEE